MAIPVPRTGHAALVTGASSGIGKELARELATRGHDIVVVARRRERLEKLAAEVREQYGIRAWALPCDLADRDDRARMLGELGELGLTLDVLVLCAGFGMVGPFLANDRDRITLMMRTNVEATFALAHSLTPAMVERRAGAVLFVSSMTGNQPMPNFAAYAATKAAVTSIAQALHCELKPFGVTVTVMCPASVSTEFSEIADGAEQAKRQPAFLTATPRQCATAGLDALADGRRTVVPLLPARVFVSIAARLPRTLWLPICRKMLQGS
ncbi:SDR family NAD(P)-dependent oxidoreductase [Mycobacterium talmoniae]|uniref:3-oxoacyl-[acyl-carrier-protein] reductase FabG n=1 Tax=Mycobacterium talmoniae TaxID=1858794 RepID=A0A1S1NMJ7_9MYCO|nr:MULTISPECIES: SDR family NAD(P)-dependent oxidoreductase [Mycobacterium]OHV05455.1 short-chain dehydrogenase [Mycobacterium talmoniae]PQM45415.1 3-oxoacyl-[acyl-carrier-protein] reductase FabG [Mycobacterium talmoniae]TDH48291.1 SDR family NAD(P)-dependent oxidoreductase [Mycobacterium eburneum]